MQTEDGKPLVSIIVAVLNAVDRLQHCIQSVSDQSYPHKELIIIDGGSIDGTIDILRANTDKIIYWESGPDEGVYDAWNKGLAHARGDWIYFLGADDYLWQPDVLERMAPHLSAAYPKHRIVYGRVAQISERGLAFQFVGDSWQKAKKRLQKEMPIPHQGVFHQRALFADHGLFDHRFRYAADYEFLARELKTRDPLFVPEVVVAGWREGGLSTDPRLNLKVLDEFRRIHVIHGFDGRGHLVFLSIKALIKLFIFYVFQGRTPFLIVLDIFRLITGKPTRILFRTHKKE